MPHIDLAKFAAIAAELGADPGAWRRALSSIQDDLARADRIEVLGPDAPTLDTIGATPERTDLPEPTVATERIGRWRGIPTLRIRVTRDDGRVISIPIAVGMTGQPSIPGRPDSRESWQIARDIARAPIYRARDRAREKRAKRAAKAAKKRAANAIQGRWLPNGGYTTD